MKYYVLKDGRILTDISLIGDQEYVELNSYPYPEYIDGKIKVVTGVQEGELVYTYKDIPEPPEPQPTQLDRIETQLNKSLDEIRAEGAAAASVNLITVGAEMTKALAAAKMDVPATAGTFAEQWDEWTPDEKTATAKSLWQYKGVGYQARTDIQKIEVYAPDVATNNYAVRPIPDINGIFPGVLNMDVSIGMKVRDWEDGKVYLCYANPITSLQWAPHNVPASFELYEG